MRTHWAVPVLFVIALMLTMSVLPAMAASGFGNLVSINPAENHGTIERTDDGSFDKYQFRIPHDLSPCTDPIEVGDVVKFQIDPANSRRALLVEAFSCPGGF